MQARVQEMMFKKAGTVLTRSPEVGRSRPNKQTIDFCLAERPQVWTVLHEHHDQHLCEQDKSKMLVWVSWQQLKSSLGEDEAKATVKVGTIQVRINPADKRFCQVFDVQETMKMSMQQRKEITGRQEGKVESKQLSNFEDAMEDLDMDQDIYDDIWQRGNGMALDMKDVKALKSGTADDGSDEDGLPIDLKEVMGVKQDKKT
jgi:hypothetical protein